MLVSVDNLIDTQVLSLQTGGRPAKTTGTIVDPRDLKVVAFYVSGPGAHHKPSILHTDDIRETSPSGLIIDNEAKIMGLDDLVRLKEIIGFGFNPIGLRVVDEDRKRLGKVTGYSVNDIDYMIEQIYCGNSFFKSLKSTGLTISRSQIVSVDGTTMVVKSTKSKAKQEVPLPTQTLVNPFRRSSQPEGTNTNY